MNKKTDYIVSGGVNVTVQCKAPIVIVLPRRSALIGNRANNIHVKTSNFRIIFNCSSTTIVYTAWSITRYKNYTTEELEPTHLQLLNVTNSDGINILSHQLTTGSYQVRFTVGMGKAGHPRYAHLKSSAFLVLTIIPSPVVATSPFFINVGKTSPPVDVTVSITNQDYPGDTSGYLYAWYCYQSQTEGTWASDNIPSTAALINIPTEGEWLFCSLPATHAVIPIM
jgi:hypothetical protein